MSMNATAIPATARQLDLVDCIYARMLELGTPREVPLEIKDLRLRDGGKFLSLAIEVGQKGDEGTMAAMLCRTRVQVFIGRHGGLTTYLGDKLYRIKLWEVPHLESLERTLERKARRRAA
jgi:hypothetical protein